MIINTMPALEAALNEESYQYLVENWPPLADALAQEVRRNATPADIRRFAMRHTQRPALAKRLEQAAAYLAAETSRAKQTAGVHPTERV